MTPTPYTEDTLVQQTTADYLRDELDWESVYAYDNEDFGAESLRHHPVPFPPQRSGDVRQRRGGQDWFDYQHKECP